MAAYVVLNIEVTDPVGYQDYVRAAGASVRKYGGELIVLGGRAQTLEGDANPKRVVILRFASYEQATDWWSSPEYAEPRRIRESSARTDTFVVEGV